MVFPFDTAKQYGLDMQILPLPPGRAVWMFQKRLGGRPCSAHIPPPRLMALLAGSKEWIIPSIQFLCGGSSPSCLTLSTRDQNGDLLSIHFSCWPIGSQAQTRPCFWQIQSLKQFSNSLLRQHPSLAPESLILKAITVAIVCGWRESWARAHCPEVWSAPSAGERG